MPDNQTNIDPTDLVLDDLFEDQIPASAAQPAAQELPAAQPLVSTEPYLQTSTGTKYLTPEDAVRGTEEKDRQIDHMRQWAIAMTGYDPISGKPVRMTPYTQEVNYARDPERFYDDLAEANEKRDKRAYAGIQLKMLQDAFLDPYKAVLTQSARSVAMENAERARPGIREFVESGKYRDYVTSIPIIHDAIATAETRPEMGTQLQDLYILAFDGANGRSMPEILRAAKAQAAPVNPATQPRPTLQPVSQPMGTTPGAAEDLSTPEGRKAIIDAAKARGLDKTIGNTMFSNLV